MSILEAWACGVPVIATRQCNVGDIAACEAGWECNADTDSIAAALKSAIEVSEAERRERGAHGRRLIETRYRWSAVVDELHRACTQYC